MRRGLWILGTLILVAAAVDAEEKCIRQTRYWGGDGPAEQLVVVNGHAFFGGWTLRVADLTDPGDPVVVHEIRLDSYPEDLEVDGDRVYVVDGGSLLTVIDAEVPYQASVAGAFVPEDPSWELVRMAAEDGLGVVGGSKGPSLTGQSTISVMDFAGPDPGPSLLGSLVIEGRLDGLALGTSTAVAVTRPDRLWFIDVTDPEQPVLTEEIDASDLIVSGELFDLEAEGNLLAISDTEGRVTLVDISDPAAPDYLGAVHDLQIGMATVEFEGDMVHAVGSTCTNAGVCGGYALINALAPGVPALVGRVDGPQMVRPVYHSGHVVAAAFNAGMRVVDLAAPSQPEMLDVTLPARQTAAIASAREFLHVVDTTNFFDPTYTDRNTLRVLERLPDGHLAESAWYRPSGMIWALAGDGTWVAAAIWDEKLSFHSVEVIDVSEPTEPTVGSRLGAEISINYESSKPHLKANGRRLVLSLADSDEVILYEVRNGRATQVGDYLPGGELVDFAVLSDDVLAVAVRQGDGGWVEVVDTSAPGSAHSVGTITMPAYADFPVDVAGEGDRVAVLVRVTGGLSGPYNTAFVVDVGTPGSPQPVFDSLPGGQWIVIGGGVYHTTADTYPPSGVRHVAVDLSTPPDPQSIEDLGRLDIYGDRVDADGRYLCLSTGRVEVYDYGPCEPIPAITFYESSDD